MSEQPTFTATELANCAAREVQQRRRVYDRLVALGKMKAGVASTEIAKMEAIRAHFAAKAAGERLL